MKEMLLEHFSNRDKYCQFYVTNTKTFLESLNILNYNFVLPYSTTETS